MKTIKHSLITAFLLIQSIYSLQAQNTEGTEFWLTFGRNGIASNNSNLDLQIRIVGGDKQTEGTIYFTNLESYIDFDINPYGVYDCSLDVEHWQAVYNTEMGKTNYSIHITSSEPVRIYAYNRLPNIFSDVTNVLPVTALGTEYYHISYTRNQNQGGSLLLDAYAVVATKNNTHLYHNGDLVETLNAGQVYYRTSDTDMTGSLITSNNPIAFFAVHQGSAIPPPTPELMRSNLFQQLAPVNTWGKNFFVPVSVIDKEIVRIFAAHNGTDITQTGGTIRIGIPGAQENLTNLQAGQFVELDVHLDSAGCYIETNKPIGVCSYIRGFYTIPPLVRSNPTQCWVPSLEQKITYSLIAPFIPNSSNYFSAYYALVVTSTPTKNNTMVSVGGAAPIALYGGGWYDNITAGMSFYSMPLTNTTTSYLFSHSEGLIIYGYAHGTTTSASYYYLAGSAMRDLDAAFYANDIHFQDLKDNPFCESEIEFRAEIEGNGMDIDTIKWYINGVEELSARDEILWEKPFSVGNYEIKMWVHFENDNTISKSDTLIIKNCSLETEFYANEVHYSYLSDTTFCNKTVHFRAEIEENYSNWVSIKWFIDYGSGYEEEVSAGDQKTWSKDFPNGTYPIRMEVLFENNETAMIISTLKVQALWIKMRNIRY